VKKILLIVVFGLQITGNLRAQGDSTGPRNAGGMSPGTQNAANMVGTAIGIGKIVKRWWKRRERKKREAAMWNTPKGKVVRALETSELDIERVRPELLPALGAYFNGMRPEAFPNLINGDPDLEEDLKTDLLIVLADDLLFHENFHAARDVYIAVLDRDKNNAMALEGLQFTQDLIAKTEAPRREAEEKLFVGAAIVEARRMSREGQPHDGILHLQMALDRFPRNADGWNALGDLYREVGQLNLAQSAYDRALALYARGP